ncbi:sugar-binding domain-containing protein [Geofilum sp. OHC36d9]|uniref:sugar-binding domain-containing protein n=1 Tax=Geofilum sp. OHC36d9 TaxID=3458413 RepID=UPI00403440FF
MRYLTGFVLFFILSLTSCRNDDNDMIIDLSGQWQFMTDTADVGVAGQWFNLALAEEVQLPGSMTQNGKGTPPSLSTQWTGSIYDSSWFFNPATAPYRKPDSLKFPFWLTPDLYYTGAAWYQKTIEIPESWEGRPVMLFLERPHWETTVWVDSIMLGMQNSLSTPHRYFLPANLAQGEHRLTIRVDNRIKEINPGPDSHSLTDHSQGNWNGLVGDLKLMALSPLLISNVKIYPDIESKEVRLVYSLLNAGSSIEEGVLKVSANSFNTVKTQKLPEIEVPVKTNPGVNTLEVIYPMGDDIALWGEFQPALYRLMSRLKLVDGPVASHEDTFGMRSFSTDSTRFVINGRPVFLRGTVDCAAFPLTGYPPTSVSDWKAYFSRLKAYGVNHVRFHSWCPPQAAFSAADELGLYLQVEGPFWTNHGTAVGYGLPVDQYIGDECRRILDEYGNHPSFVMFAYGNEPAGRYQIEFLDSLVNVWKAYDNRRLYAHASIGQSWPLAPSNEFIVRAGARGLPWGHRPQSEFDYGTKIAPFQVPYVAHEMGQFCVFPDFSEIPQYTGVMKPRNFEMFRQELIRKKMGDQAHDFLMASGKFQVLCYKQEIEASLRTPGNGGMQLLGIADFPGQGSAIVGVANVFAQPKAYVAPADFKHFFDATVPLSRFSKFVFTNNDTLDVQLEVAHFGPQVLKEVIPHWRITNAAGEVWQEGDLPTTDVTWGNTVLGRLSLPLESLKMAVSLHLQLQIGDFVNGWDFWVYPQSLPESVDTSVYIAHEWDQTTRDILNNGGKVLLLAAGKVEHGKDVKQYFRPVFWNTSWFKMRPPHTLGILCDPTHPALADFPTQYHSNMQWWELLQRQQVMNVDSFPADFKPIVQPIDTWFLNRKLALIFEARVGNGKLMVCSSDIENHLQDRPAARQMRYSLLRYMQSEQFEPALEIGFNLIDDLFIDRAHQAVDFHTNDSPDELKPKL